MGRENRNSLVGRLGWVGYEHGRSFGGWIEGSYPVLKDNWKERAFLGQIETLSKGDIRESTIMTPAKTLSYTG